MKFNKKIITPLITKPSMKYLGNSTNSFCTDFAEANSFAGSLNFLIYSSSIEATLTSFTAPNTSLTALYLAISEEILSLENFPVELLKQ